MSIQMRSSDVWKFFTPANSEYANCNICKKKLSYKTTISNLKKHLGAVHPTISLAWKRKHQLQPPQSSTVNPDPIAQPGPSSFSPSTFADSSEHFKNLRRSTQRQTTTFLPTKITAVSHKDLDDKLLNLFIKDLQPFSIVEDEGLREFIQALNPKYKLPNKHFISDSLIPSLFEERKHNCIQKLQTAIQMSITIDTWTSLNTNSFIAITVHFVNTFKLESHLLECVEMTESHTSENLAQILRLTCTKWEIFNKINFAITDNAANIKNAITNFSNWEHMPCFAHTLNLIVKSSLDNSIINSLLDNLRTIVKYFKRNTTAAEKLRTYQITAGQNALKLIHDVSTRWNSTYYMIDRFILLENPIKATIAIIKKNLPYISNTKWELLHELAVILKPIEAATKIITREHYPMASIMIPLISGLRNICEKLKQKNFSVNTKEVICQIEAAIFHRFQIIENNTVVQICTFLDPRFKNALFSSETVDILKIHITNMLDDNANINNVIKNETNSEMPDITDELSIWDALELEVNVKKNSPDIVTLKNKILIEIDQYLCEEFLIRTGDPIIWWKNHQFQFPLLKNLVERLFCIVATSVPCERVFSKAGLIFNEKRNRLKADKLSMLLFLNSNT